MSDQGTYIHAPGEAIQRTKPSFWDPRSYYLKELLKAIRYGASFIDKPSSRLIDLGCGAMPYKKVFSDQVAEYLGADLKENLQADILVSDEGRVETEDGAFDVVLSTQVLEHVSDPSFYLKECHRLLKKDGMLLLSTHGYWMYHPDPTDFWRWTSSGLKKVVSAEGFEVVRFHGIIGRAAMGLQLFQDGVMFKLPSFLRPFFTAPMQLMICLFDRLEKQKHKDADACTFLVIAKKK